MNYHNNTENYIKKKCFVCEYQIKREDSSINKKTNLPVCDKCKNTKKELEAEKKAIDSLGEDFVCGCI